MAMARSDERTPLLLEIESVDSYDLKSVPDTFIPSKADSVSINENDLKLVAVFVATFDTRHGNTLEWTCPRNMDLDGVEFKSLASGLHHVAKDFVYFKINDYYGLSCFEKISVSSVQERGARMKSVGVLAHTYRYLHLHREFLQRQVRAQLEKPGDYGSLEEYLRHFPQRVPKRHPSASDDSQVMQQAHPDGCFSDFMHFFGPHIFVLWKLALLHKRIIFYSPPPVGEVCQRVYCTSLLTSHKLDKRSLQTDHNPCFYINVADIETLSCTRTYIACTTEKIFQIKHNLYDVFVDSCQLHTHSQYVEPLLRVSRADRERFEHLVNLRSNHLATRAMWNGSRAEQDDLGFAEFFAELNTVLFRTMMDVSSCDDHVMTTEMMVRLGLDPVYDKGFISDLAVLYGFDVVVQRNVGMCSCFTDCYCLD